MHCWHVSCWVHDVRHMHSSDVDCFACVLLGYACTGVQQLGGHTDGNDMTDKELRLCLAGDLGGSFTGGALGSVCAVVTRLLTLLTDRQRSCISTTVAYFVCWLCV